MLRNCSPLQKLNEGAIQGNKYPTVTSYKERLIKLNLLSLQYSAETRKDLI